MIKWAKTRLKELEKENLCGFIFKSKSPSSGYREIKIYSPKGIRKGSGIFASAFTKHFPHIPVEDEISLQDPKVMKHFIEQIFNMKRSTGSLRRAIK